MKAGIITIGDELLIGQTVNSNAAWMGQELSSLGVDIFRSATIKDDRESILSVVDEYFQSVDLVIVTGGLGPTKDDLTKKTWCTYFQDELILNEGVMSHIEEIFEKYVKTPILPANKSQAYLPSKSIPLFNKYGTEPSMVLSAFEDAFMELSKHFYISEKKKRGRINFL